MWLFGSWKNVIFLCFKIKKLCVLKEKSNTPRRKRMNGQSRLLAAQHWIKSYNGKSLIKGYAKWFGVDKLCAIRELKILGVPISDALEKQITDSVKQRIAKKLIVVPSPHEESPFEDYF